MKFNIVKKMTVEKLKIELQEKADLNPLNFLFLGVFRGEKKIIAYLKRDKLMIILRKYSNNVYVPCFGGEIKDLGDSVQITGQFQLRPGGKHFVYLLLTIFYSICFLMIKSTLEKRYNILHDPNAVYFWGLCLVFVCVFSFYRFGKSDVKREILKFLEDI